MYAYHNLSKLCNMTSSSSTPTSWKLQHVLETRDYDATGGAEENVGK